MTTTSELRDWARGNPTLEAATELLIGGGFTQGSQPWLHYDEELRSHWIDFEAIPQASRGWDVGEIHLPRIAASIATDIPVILGDELGHLGRERIPLVLTAIAHAAGGHHELSGT